MATYEKMGRMTYKDESNNKYILYPATKKECVDGISEIEDAVQYLSDVISDILDNMSSDVGNHNTSSNAHSDIRTLIQGLTTRLNALANSDDTTLDQLAELVAYIKANRELIESVTTSKVNVNDIINNLTTNVPNKPLSAAQGVALKNLIDAIVVPTRLSQLTNDSGYITGYTETDPTVPSWAKQSSKPTYTAPEVGADPSGTAAAEVSDHNTSTSAHDDIRKLINQISSEIVDHSEALTIKENGKEDVIYTGEHAKTITIPTALPNQVPLTIKLGTDKTYTYLGNETNEPVVIDIKSYVDNSVQGSLSTTKPPSVLPNEYPLVFSGDVFKTDVFGGYSYDGRSEVTINIDDNVEGIIDAKLSAAIADIEIPTELPSPKALKVKVSEDKTYEYTGSNDEEEIVIDTSSYIDASTAMSIADLKIKAAIDKIDIPTELPNPKALKITVDGTTYTYTGSSAETPVDISINTGTNETEVNSMIDAKVSSAVTPINAKLDAGVKNPNKLKFTGGFTGEYDGSIEQTINTPAALPNPSTLTLRYGDTEHTITYDGSNSREVTIPLVPVAIKNPNSLTLTVNDKPYSYDGSDPISVKIDTSLNETRVNELIDAEISKIKIPTELPNPKSLKITVNGTSYTYKGNETNPVEIPITTGTNTSEVNALISTATNDLRQSVDDIATAVASHSTQISTKANTSTVTALETNLSNYKNSVSTTYATKAELNNIDIPTIPAYLPNQYSLKFTGGSTVEYNGSVAKTVNIPTVPESIKNPNALVVNYGAAAENGSAIYDGSERKEITIPTMLPNPNKLVLDWGNGMLPDEYDGSLERVITMPTTYPNPEKLVFTGGSIGEYDGSTAKTIAIPTIPAYLPNQYALTINGASYNGSSAVDMTQAINSLIEDKLGVIENGTY